MSEDFTPKKYTIIGKHSIQATLSPFQQMSFSFQIVTLMKEIDDNKPSEPPGPEFDFTPYMNILEFEAPQLLVEIANVILKNPETGKPGYYDNYLTLQDFMNLDPKTTLEVVADFFTINDVANLFMNLAGLSQLKALVTKTPTGLN